MVSDIWDTQQWENAFGENGIFCGDPRGIALQFSTDGVNPYSANKVQYFMWPMMTTLLNLPKNLRHLFSGISLLGIIPGNDGEPKKSDPYMEILVDELLELSEGVPSYDALSNSSFLLRAGILNYVLDYPGLNKAFCTTGANSIDGCMWCEVQGKGSCFLSYNHYYSPIALWK